jgi:hypothetical protein
METPRHQYAGLQTIGPADRILVRMNARNELTVFVSEHCFNCRESLVIAEEIKQKYPDVVVNVFNVDKGARPDVDIFAVPTYALNGKVVFLGNPTNEQLETLFGQKPTPASKS